MRFTAKIWMLLAGLLMVPLVVFASVTVTVNGSNHTIPQTNERGWGANVTAWIQAISANTLQPSGGTFTLTADTNFGPDYGLVSIYYKSRTANPAGTGVLRLANNEGVGWRNAANGANLVLKVNASDVLEFNGVAVPTVTSASVQDSTFSIYDNGDPTKLIAFQASGITTGTTRTLTVPDASGTLLLADNTATVIGKALDADDNTLTDIDNNDIKAAAAIAVNKLAALTASRAVVSDGSGFLTQATTTVTEIGYVNGVTSSLCGINQSCIVTNKTIDGDDNTVQDIANASIKAAAAIAVNKLAALTASRVVVSDGSGFISAADTSTYPTLTELSYVKGVTSAIQTQIAAATTSSSNPYKVSNCSLAASVGSSALTVALKDASGSDPSGGSPCTVAFRNATATTGTYADVSATAAASVVVSNGSSLGCTATAQCVLYVYAVNNAGTMVLGVIGGTTLDEGSVQSGVAEGGAGGADTINTLYTTATQSSKAIRLLGRVTITPAASFAWTNAAAEVSNVPLKTNPWYVNAYMDGANPDLSINAAASYIEMINASMTLTPIAGSAPVGVMCSTTNAATAPSTSATVCAAGSESIGINFAIQEPGAYEVCIDFAWFAQCDSAETLAATFQLIETPTNAQTLTLESGARTSASLVGGATDSAATYPFTGFCGVFNWSSAAAGTTKGVRLMFEQSNTNTPDSSLILADASSSAGQRNIHWRVRKL